MKPLVFLMLFLPSYVMGQATPDNIAVSKLNTDTNIGTSQYKIVERFKNGKVKLLGSFAQGCNDTISHKCGPFITFNKHGKKVKTRVYFFDQKICRRILGLKNGRWGIYGPVKYYFLGFVTWRGIIDPCF